MAQNEAATVSAAPRRLGGRLGALGNPVFRLFWLSMFASFLGNQMQIVAQGWLVLELTNSPLYLGLTGGAAGLPVLVFSLFGGVMADRLERRRLLILGQLAITCLILAVTILILTGRIQVWHVMVVAVGLGLIMAFNDPARQAFVTELVTKDELLNAVSWNATAMNITRVGGPMVAGAVIGAAGTGLAYLINTAISLLATAMMLPIPKSKGGAEARKATVWSNAKEGLSFVRGNQTVFALLLMAALPTTFGAMGGVLVPVFARDVLHVGATGLGQLMAANGFGALLGSLTIAAMGNMRRKGIVFLCGALGFSTGVIVFGLSNWFPLSLAAMAFQGFAIAFWLASITTLLQTNTPNELRGRVMSLYLLAIQAVLFSQFLGGALASLIGAPITVAVGGFLALAINASALAFTSVIRRLD